MKRGTRFVLILSVSITIVTVIALWWFWGDIVGAPAPATMPTHTSVGVISQATTPPTQTEISILLPTNPPAPTPILAHTPSPQPTPTPTPGPDLDTIIGPASPFLIHKVEAGETLFFIATTFNSSVEAILATNDLGDPPLWVDQLIVIPAGITDPSGLLELAIYRVAEGGETVDAVAAAYGAIPEDLRRFNNLGEGPNLPGDRWLIIPLEA